MKGAGSARRSTRVRPQVVWSLVHKWVVWSGRVSKVVGVIRIVVWVLLLTIGDRHAAPIVLISMQLWHAVLQLHQLLYRHMTLYITPEKTGLRRLVDKIIMLLRYNVVHFLSDGGR